MENVSAQNASTEKVFTTRERQAQQRRKRIINASMELFQEKCVEDTSMEEVAKRASVGAATVYRYFSTKIELVIETAQAYWEKIAGEYLKELELANCREDVKYCKEDIGRDEEEAKDGCAEKNSATGYEQLAGILNIFYKIFKEQKPFLKFLQEFDVFVKKYQISEERLTDYENGILKLKPYMTSVLEKGLSDKSLFFTCSVDEMYFSLTHTLIALMEKLAVGGDILSSDQEVEGQKQFQIIAGLLLSGMQYIQQSGIDGK